MPTLSIIMPVFNAEPFIKEAVGSLLSQTFTDFELIIVNDGCTDRSIEIVREFNDPRIRILTNEVNSGIVFSRNRGTTAAIGKYIAPFDADDVARNDKFEKQIRFLENHPEYGMIGSWALLIDETGKTMKQRWKVNAPPERIPSILLFRNYFVQSAMLIRREALPEGNYSPGYDVVEDYKMWIDISRKYKTWNYPDYLVKYRIHPKSITNLEIQKMEDRDTRIFDYAYKSLDITLDTKQKRFLLSIKNSHTLTNADQIKELEDLLLYILHKNMQLKTFNHKELVKVAFNRYLKACRIVGISRPKILQALCNSALAKQYLMNSMRL
jgi:glycosyltransferase involved in cell wall biosynthesis